MPPKIQKSKEAKMKAAMSGGKGKKKKWSRGKTKEQVKNMFVFDKPTYEKLLKDIPKKKVITPAIVSDSLKISGSLARRALIELQTKNLIKPVSRSSHLCIYTRVEKE